MKHLECCHPVFAQSFSENESRTQAKRTVAMVALIGAVSIASGCSSRIVDRAGSGGDAAPINPPVNMDTIIDAVPQPEPLSATGNAPYKVFGVRYVPMKQSRGYAENGVASWYGTKFHGRKTSSGEPYDMFGMTAAHKTLPLPTYARVENLANGRAVIVKINDRGPFANNRLIDMSYVAAQKLDMVREGTARVRVTAIDTGQNYVQGQSNEPVVTSYSNPMTTGPVVSESIYPGSGPASSQVNYGQTQNGTYNSASAGTYTQSAVSQPSYNTTTTSAGAVIGAATGGYVANQQTVSQPSFNDTTYSQTATQAADTQSTYQSTPGYTVWQSGSSTSTYQASTPTYQELPPVNPAANSASVYQTQSGYNSTGTVQYQTQTQPQYQSGQSVDYASNAPVPPSPYTPPAQSGGGIYVQVGAFGNMGNAMKVQDALNQRGFTPVVVMPVQRASGTLYRVRIGPMPSYALADSELARLTNSISFGGRPRVVVE